MTRTDVTRELDRVAGQLLAVGREARSMPMDLYREGEHYVAHLDLPGVDPGSVDIEIDGPVLTIRAERTPRTAEGLDWLSRERPAGSYLRQVKIGPGVETESIHASLEHGVLTLTLPIAERAKRRRIEVQSTHSGASVLESSATEAEPAEPATASAV